MREWHAEQMEKTIVKFVTGLSENATNWQRRQRKRYRTITHCCRQINYDLKKFSRFYKKFEVIHPIPVLKII